MMAFTKQGISLAILSMLLFVLPGELRAQHTPLYSQYMYNTMALNPAYAGSQDVMTATMLYRNQWTGFEGAPKTMVMSAHAPLKSKKVGVGAVVYNDKIGVVQNTGVYANYAYILRTERGRLAYGFKAGASFMQADWSQVVTTTAGDVAFQTNSPVHVLPNFGFGAYYWDKQYFAGISTPEILTHTLATGTAKPETSSGLRNLIVTAGYQFKPKRYLNVKTSVILKRNRSTGFQYDINGSLLWNDQIGVGLAYRSRDALVGLFEMKVNDQLKFGYSYDMTLSALRAASSGSHELMLQYRFGYVNQSMNPRSFF